MCTVSIGLCASVFEAGLSAVYESAGSAAACLPAEGYSLLFLNTFD